MAGDAQFIPWKVTCCHIYCAHDIASPKTGDFANGLRVDLLFVQTPFLAVLCVNGTGDEVSQGDESTKGFFGSKSLVCEAYKEEFPCTYFKPQTIKNSR